MPHELAWVLLAGGIVAALVAFGVAAFSRRARPREGEHASDRWFFGAVGVACLLVLVLPASLQLLLL